MGDRELLELAAKAAGISIWKHGKTDGAFINNRAEAWSPLTNDGDALRLAVKLRLDMEWSEEVISATSFEDGVLVTVEPYGPASPDPFAAMRSAIVRAAAEIGRAMQ